MEFNISKESLEIDGKYFSFRTEDELKNKKYTLYLYVEGDSAGTLFAKFGEAKSETVWERYIRQTGITNPTSQMTHIWESDKGDKEIHALLKNHTSGIGFRWAGNKGDIVNTEEAYIIDSLEGFENLVSEITKAADSTPAARKERTPYGDITKLVDDILKKHETNEKFNLDLCTRWGKTSTMLEIFRRSEYRVCFMCSYIKTVKTSYKTDIDTLVPYENMVMIDPDDFRDDPESCVKHCMKILRDPNKKIMYYIALTGTYDENEEIKEDEESISTFQRRTVNIEEFKKMPSMMVVEEADFGAHCEEQVKKLRDAYKSSDSKLFIATTGTNAEKAESIFESDCYIKRDYMLDVLRSEYRPSKVGLEWNVLNNSGMVKYLGYSEEEMENFVDMTEIVGGHLKNEEWFRQVLRYIYKTDDRPLTRNSRALAKARLVDESAATMIFMPVGYDGHKAMAKLIENTFPGEAIVQVIDGSETTNEEAEQRAKNFVKDEKGKRVFFIATGMANRSFSVPEIKNVILFNDGGSYSSIAQKIARGFTPWNMEHSMNHIIDFRLSCEEDFGLRSYLSGLGQAALDDSTSTEDIIKTLVGISTSTDKLLFNEYFEGEEEPIRNLSDEELDLMMRTTDFEKKMLCKVYGDIQDKLDVPSICGLSEKEDKTKDLFNTNIRGDKKSKKSDPSVNHNKKSDENAKKAKEDLDKKYQHFLFLINHFHAYFDTYEYTENVLKNTFENMSDKRKQLLEETFEIDMNFMEELVNVLIARGADGYFDKVIA